MLVHRCFIQFSIFNRSSSMHCFRQLYMRRFSQSCCRLRAAFQSSQLQWKRPKDVVPFPKVWHTFHPTSGAVSAAGNNVFADFDIRIEDVTPDRHEEIIEFMHQYYINDNLIFRASGLKNDPVSLASYDQMISDTLTQDISVIAVLASQSQPGPQKSKIIGVNLRNVITRGDPDMNSQVSGEAIKNIVELRRALRENNDPLELLQSNICLRSKEISVHPEYRGLNISFEFFSNMEQMSKVFKIPASIISLSTTGSQVLAEKCGFKVYNQIEFDQYKKDGKVVFKVDGMKAKAFKWMGRRYDIGSIQDIPLPINY